MPAAAHPQLTSQQDVDAPCVLLVEDDPVTATLTGAQLEAAGAQVRHVATAEAAMACLEAGELPDVLLTDLRLPGASGVELCRELRTRPAMSSLPIVLVTVADDRQVRLDAIAEGADDLLTKPVDPAELTARVHSLTRLARARRQLDVSRRLAAVVASVSDGVVVLDEDGVVRDGNHRAGSLLGCTLGRQLLPCVRERFTVEADRVLSDGTRREVHLHRPRSGNEQALWMTLTIVPLPDDPGRAQVAVVRDVTEERVAARLADVVLSSVAHKLRTPLTGILTAGRLLEHLLQASPHQPVAAALVRNAGRLDAVLGEILQHAGLLAAPDGSSAVEVSPDDLRPVLLEHVGPDAAAALRRGSVDVDQRVALHLAVVRTAMEEFVANAVLSGDSAPRAFVEVAGGDLVVAVEDDGHGFPPEDAERLFSAFFQVDRTGQAPGSGLGLSLVAHVVGRVGGSVRATCPSDGPTRFEARFPVAVDGPGTSSAPPPPDADQLVSDPSAGTARRAPAG